MSEIIEPYTLNGSYGRQSREGQYEKLCRLYERLSSAVADPDTRPSSLERVREEIVTHVADMKIPFDDALQLLRRIGVAGEIPEETTWLEVLGLGAGAVIQYGGSKKQTVHEAGMTLNKMAGPDVKPYAWFTTPESSSPHIVGANLATRSLETSIRVIKRRDEIDSTTGAQQTFQ